MVTWEGWPLCEVHALPAINHDAKQIWLWKEELTQTVLVKKSRLNAERIDRDQMNIEVILLEQSSIEWFSPTISDGLPTILGENRTSRY